MTELSYHGVRHGQWCLCQTGEDENIAVLQGALFHRLKQACTSSGKLTPSYGKTQHSAHNIKKVLAWRKMTKQAERQAKQPSQMACISGDLKCWGAWDTTCKHKAKDIAPSIAWRRCMKRGSAWWSSLEGKRNGHHQSDKYWNCFKAMSKKLLKDGKAHVGFFKSTDTILNCTWNVKHKNQYGYELKLLPDHFQWLSIFF